MKNRPANTAGSDMGAHEAGSLPPHPLFSLKVKRTDWDSSIRELLPWVGTTAQRPVLRVWLGGRHRLLDNSVRLFLGSSANAQEHTAKHQVPEYRPTHPGCKSFSKCEGTFVREATLMQAFNRKSGLPWRYMTNLHTQEVQAGGWLQVPAKAGLHSEFKA